MCDAAYSLEIDEARESCRSIIFVISKGFELFSCGDGFAGGVDVLLFAGLDFSSFGIGPDDVSKITKFERKRKENRRTGDEFFPIF